MRIVFVSLLYSTRALDLLSGVRFFFFFFWQLSCFMAATRQLRGRHVRIVWGERLCNRGRFNVSAHLSSSFIFCPKTCRDWAVIEERATTCTFGNSVTALLVDIIPCRFLYPNQNSIVIKLVYRWLLLMMRCVNGDFNPPRPELTPFLVLTVL